MSLWDLQADGSILGVSTEKTLAWAVGDHHKIAAVAFVAWCRDTGQQPEWYLDTWDQVAVTVPHAAGPMPAQITVLLDASPDRDAYLVQKGKSETTYAVVRVLSGPIPVVHILGLTGILDQHQRNFDGPIPRTHLLSCVEWLPSLRKEAA